MALTDKTYAVVVAIEEYAQLGNGWNLPGVGSQAVEFVHWLIRERGVSAGNVRVFASGCDSKPFADLGVGAQHIRAATAENVNAFFAGIGAYWPAGELLLVYWVGHGFVSRDGVRRLVLADAAPNLKTNLDVDQLTKVLRSAQRGGFRKQIAIVDTCARFFEALQSSTDLPAGGLNPGPPKEAVEQYFYFAASSGQYATKNAFGPQVLKLLRCVPVDEWPPDSRRMRCGIEDMFERLLAERNAEQQPAWLEYRDGLDNTFTRGVQPTHDDIFEVSHRAGVPLSYLRTLTEFASECGTLTTKNGRDALVQSLQPRNPLFRPVDLQPDTKLDLMRIITGAIEQELATELAASLVTLESNSDSSYRFGLATKKIQILRGFWPLLQATQLAFGRARALYRASYLSWKNCHEPVSVEAILQTLLELNKPDSLVEFLLRVAGMRPADPSCRALDAWVEGCNEWVGPRGDAKSRLEKEAATMRFLLVEVDDRDGTWRVTRSWLWTAGTAVPQELDAVDEAGDLAGDISALLNEVEQEGGTVHLEILAPARLLHLDRRGLASKHVGGEIDPEEQYPVTLRWRERMAARPRDPSFRTGRWKRVAGEIEKRRQSRAPRVEWLQPDCDLDAFCREFDEGGGAELVGIPLASDGDGRDDLIGLICHGGLPYVCWPRSGAVDLVNARASVGRMLIERQFESIPQARTHYELADLLLLWDDPKRNPYDHKMGEVGQR